jgi:curli biogenesis system outer membrane secretion channel CsgG
VTAFEEDVETRERGGGLFSAPTVERVSQGGYLAIDLRVIDVATGEVAYARTVEGRTEGGVKRDSMDDGDIFGSDNAPDARAVRAAVIEIIDYLECALLRRDACLEDFARKDRERVERTRKAAKTR